VAGGLRQRSSALADIVMMTVAALVDHAPMPTMVPPRLTARVWGSPQSASTGCPPFPCERPLDPPVRRFMGRQTPFRGPLRGSGRGGVF
jgi:hypothetical protein